MERRDWSLDGCTRQRKDEVGRVASDLEGIYREYEVCTRPAGSAGSFVRLRGLERKRELLVPREGFENSNSEGFVYQNLTMTSVNPLHAGSLIGRDRTLNPRSRVIGEGPKLTKTFTAGPVPFQATKRRLSAQVTSKARSSL